MGWKNYGRKKQVERHEPKRSSKGGRLRKRVCPLRDKGPTRKGAQPKTRMFGKDLRGNEEGNSGHGKKD